VHELSIATAIHRQCRARLPRGARLEQVSVRVGELAALDAELLGYAWEAVVAGGPDAGATLAIERVPARLLCDACERAVERAAGEWRTSCPSCGGPLRVEGGTELDLLRFSHVTGERAERTP
jgi:hydrogenase nickel incorporation protein HypA/HybF